MKIDGVCEGNEIRCPELFKDKKSNGYIWWLDYEMWLISKGTYTAIRTFLSERKGGNPVSALACMLGTYCGLYIRAYIDSTSFEYPVIPDSLLEADDLFEKGFTEEEKLAFWQGFDDKLGLEVGDYKAFADYILKMDRFHLSHLILHRFVEKLEGEQTHLSNLGRELKDYDEFCHGLQADNRKVKPDCNDKYEDVPLLYDLIFNKEEMSVLNDVVKSGESSEDSDKPKIVF